MLLVAGETTMSEKNRTSTSSARARTHFRTSICTSLSGRTSSELAAKAREAFTQGTDLVEFRIDLLRSPIFEKVEANLSRFSGRSVFAVHPAAEGGGFEGEESERLALVRRLGELGPAYLDVELRTLEANRDLAPKGLGLNIIVSWHDPVRTPDRASLLRIMAKAASYGGLVKVVTTANSAADNLTILSLYDEPGQTPIAFCMGAQGLISRVMAMERGTPIVYASLPDEPTASGQPSLGYILAIRRLLESA